MKRLIYSGLIVLMLLPAWSVNAQSVPKTPVVQVPITYPGDTSATIARRAKWIQEAKKEGTLVWWSSLKPDQSRKIMSEVNKIYPFISVSFWRGDDKEREVKFDTENSINRVTVDITDPGAATSYARWRAKGFIDKYTDIIPGIEKRDKRTYSKYGDWAQIGNNAITPQYNTRLVSSADAPKSWEDLLNPKWKGSIGISADVKVWYVLALGEGGWGIDKTEDFLRKLKQQEPIWAPGHSAGFNLMVAGEYKIMGENFLRYVFDSQKKGAPADWIRAHPVAITGGPLLLAKKAPHPNTARLFIEWLFSPQGLVTYEKVTGYGTAFPGSGTELSKALIGMPLVYRTEELVIKAAELDLENKFAKILGVTPE